MLGEERILPEFLFPLLSGGDMRSSLERKISHEIVSSGRSGNCEFEYADESSGITKRDIGSILIVGLLVLSVFSAIGLANASSATITTYFDVTATVSVSVSFPTGLTNVSFTDSSAGTVQSNITATSQTTTTNAFSITNTGDTNISTLTAAFGSSLQHILGTSSGGTSAVTFFGMQMNFKSASGGASYGTANTAGSLDHYWLPANSTTTQSLLGGAETSADLLAYTTANILYVWCWASFAAQLYAGYGTDTLTVTYAA